MQRRRWSAQSLAVSADTQQMKQAPVDGYVAPLAEATSAAPAPVVEPGENRDFTVADYRGYLLCSAGSCGRGPSDQEAAQRETPTGTALSSRR